MVFAEKGLVAGRLVSVSGLRRLGRRIIEGIIAAFGAEGEGCEAGDAVDRRLLDLGRGPCELVSNHLFGLI